MVAMRGSYWGKNGGGIEAVLPAPIRLKYKSGAEITEKFLVGVIAVMRGDASVIDDRGRVVFPMKMVICQRMNECRDAGTPVTVIDPGRSHDVFIFPKAKTSPKNPIPVVHKAACRAIGECDDPDPDLGCKNCCNCLKHRENKK